MPNQKKIAVKAAQCGDLTAKIKAAVSGVLVTYAGITVEQDTQLRAALRKAGVEYKVYKNTMTERACEAAGYGAMKPYLTGMTALATSEKDPVAPAKILKEYTEKVPSFEIKAGFVDGGVIDQKGVIALSDIPSREAMICKIMLSMKSPLYNLAYALQAIIDKSEKSSAEPETAPEAAPETAPAV